MVRPPKPGIAMITLGNSEVTFERHLLYFARKCDVKVGNMSARCESLWTHTRPWGKTSMPQSQGAGGIGVLPQGLVCSCSTTLARY